MKWEVPYTISNLLDNFKKPLPPEEKSVYLISRKIWRNEPKESSEPIYVGSNTGKSKRFRTRIGDLIADMFGLYCDATCHHSGGKKIHKYCKENGISPKELYIGWLKECSCSRCAENEIFRKLGGKEKLLNRKCPPRCAAHN